MSALYTHVGVCINVYMLSIVVVRCASLVANFIVVINCDFRCVIQMYCRYDEITVISYFDFIRHIFL